MNWTVERLLNAIQDNMYMNWGTPVVVCYATISIINDLVFVGQLSLLHFLYYRQLKFWFIESAFPVSKVGNGCRVRGPYGFTFDRLHCGIQNIGKVWAELETLSAVYCITQSHTLHPRVGISRTVWVLFTSHQSASSIYVPLRTPFAVSSSSIK